MPREPTVVLMCGLPGSGKSTYARHLVSEGYVRLSLDEVIWKRLGERDPGRVLEAGSFAALKEEVRREQRKQLAELVAAGRDVVVDYTFWSRSARADYVEEIRAAGGQPQLIYVRTDIAELRRRLAARQGQELEDSVTVSPALLEEYLGKFEEPHGEGERVIDT